MKISPLTQQILDTIGTGVVIWVLLGHPTKGVQLVKKYFSAKDRQRQYRFKKRLTSLEEQGIILLGGEVVRLTEKGKKLLQTVHQPIFSDEKWDGMWRLVSYDIPNSKRVQRDAFRRDLKALGFSQIQESIWVFPYECKEKIAVIAQEYGISPYVLYMNATTLPIALRLIRRYGLRTNADY